MIGTPTRKRFRSWLAFTCFALLCETACEAPEPETPQKDDFAILGTDAAAPITGLALIRHTDGGVLCSGALIAKDLLATAKHCLFRSGPTGDEALDLAGFRVGFGPNVDQLVEREVDWSDWVETPDNTSIASSAVDGEDVAVLHLFEPAPASESVRSFLLTLQPSNDQPVQVAGFGLTNLKTGESGIRGVAEGHISGFDPKTGVLQISGSGACFGDSGGPVLSQDEETVLGVLGEVGDTDAGFCSSALSYGDTAANVQVQRFLAKACARVGGCGPQLIVGGATGDGGNGGEAGQSAAAGTPEVSVASIGGAQSTDAGAPDVSHSSRNPASGCALVRPSPRRATLDVIVALLSLAVTSRRNARRIRTKKRAPA